MLKIDATDFEKLVRDLSVVNRKGIPYAVRNALNQCAFDARARWKAEQESKLVLRNTWTTRQLRVDKATGTDVSAMFSLVGSLAPYMDETEEGAPRTTEIRPTPGAAGQGKATKRTRPTRRALGYGKLARAAWSSTHRHKGVRVKLGIWAARKRGDKIAYLQLSQTKGFFRIMGTKRRSKLLLLWEEGSAGPQPAIPTLGPAFDWVTRPSRMDRTFKRNFWRELKRLNAFGY